MQESHGEWRSEVLTLSDQTPISMTLSKILMDPSNFKNPREFQPDRWLCAPTEQARLGLFFVPFGRGIGRVLA